MESDQLPALRGAAQTAFDVAMWEGVDFATATQDWRERMHALAAADRVDIAARSIRFREACAPLKAIDPKLTGRLAQRLRAELLPLGVGINPMMSPDQSNAWLNALVAQLSDFPPRIAIEAARLARHSPMRYFGDVHPVVRGHADRLCAHWHLADMRWRKLLCDIAWAPLLPKPQPELLGRKG